MGKKWKRQKWEAGAKEDPSYSFVIGALSRRERVASRAALRGHCALTRAIPAHEAEPGRSINAWYTRLVQLSRVLSSAVARQHLFLPLLTLPSHQDCLRLSVS